MQWLQLHIDASPASIEAVCDMLREIGIEGLSIEDESDFQTFLLENHQYWDYVDENLEKTMAGKCRVTFYLKDSQTGYTQLAAARIALTALQQAHPDFPTLILSMENIEDADWENNWKAFYKPMEIGERLIVVPDWEQAEAGDRVELRLNPGLAFGTGSHATTRLCLTALEKHVEKGMRVLDLGCGSGILSIASLLLGAESAFACDIDEKAVDIAYENAALNGVGRDRYTVRAGDVLSDKGLRREMGDGYDIVAANIVSDVIIALAPEVSRWMKPEGWFLCSGIIDDRAAEVRQVLEENGFAVAEEGQSEGWFGFLCRRGG